MTYEFLEFNHVKFDKPRSLFIHWLSHCYVYYVHNEAIISDDQFDQINNALKNYISNGYIPSNPGFATMEALEAGTGHHIPPEYYPGRIASIVHNAFKDRKIKKIIGHDFAGVYLDGMAWLPNEDIIGAFDPMQRVTSKELKDIGLIVPIGHAVHYDQDNRIHREDGPAVIFEDGHEEWYRHGQKHREYGPADKDINGEYQWYLFGELYGSGNNPPEDYLKELERN